MVEADDMDFCVVVSEVNLVGSNPCEWWVDIETSCHVCSDKLFTTLEPPTKGEQLYMGNFSTGKVKGQGKMVLKMTSGNELMMNNVLYVPEGGIHVFSEEILGMSLVVQHTLKV